MKLQFLYEGLAPNMYSSMGTVGTYSGRYSFQISAMTGYTNRFITVFINQFSTLKFTNSSLSPTHPYSLHNLMLLLDTDDIVIK